MLQLQRTFTGHRGPIYAMHTVPDRETFISGGGDGHVVGWDPRGTDHGVVMVAVEQAIFALHHDGRWLHIGTEGGDLHVVDMELRREFHRYQVHTKGIFRIISLPQERIACAGGDGSISIWNRQSNGALRLFRHLPLAQAKLRDLALDPDGGTLAVACGDGLIRLLDTELFNEYAFITAHASPEDGSPSTGVSSLAYHPQKPVLVSGGKDGHIAAWKIADHTPVLRSPAHKGGIYKVLFHKDLCATVSRDKTVKIWSAGSLEPIQRLDRAAGGHTHSVNAALWCAGSLITASDDRTIKVWGLAS